MSLQHFNKTRSRFSGCNSRSSRKFKRTIKVYEKKCREQSGLCGDNWSNFTEDCKCTYFSLNCRGSLKRQTFLTLLVLSVIFLGVQFHFTQELKRNNSTTNDLNDLVAMKGQNEIQTRGCTIPYFNPLDASVIPFLDFVQPVVCSRITPLTTIERLMNTEDDYELRIHEELITLYVSYGSKLCCCYSNITRDTDDTHSTSDTASTTTRPLALNADGLYKVSPCIHFRQPLKLLPSEEFILAKCFSHQENRTKKTLVYSNTHFAVRMKTKVRERVETSDDSKNLNVLVLCYDSMSRQNLRRTLPKTMNFLEGMGFFSFHGFSKIGEDTFSNAFGMLTGLTVKKGRESYWETSAGEDQETDPVHRIDESPFIWKDFASQGYTTAFVDDGPTMGASNWNATFVRQPTDYFIRPGILASEELLSIKYKFNNTICTGPEAVIDRVLNYLMSLITSSKNRKHFSVAWLGSFNRDHINLPRIMDDRTLQFFQELGLYNVLNDTVVFFMSSRGMWEAQIQNRIQGWYEKRMPFLFISVPPWFGSVYPEKHRNLLKNTLNVVSMFDLYATFRDVLNLAKREGNATTSVCPKCLSLFSQMGEDRSCADAGISSEFCTCTNFKETTADKQVVNRAADFVVKQLRLKLRRYIDRNICADLTLHSVVKALVSDKWEYFVGMYRLTFKTQPGGGLFQSGVYHNNASDSFILVGPIERINANELGRCVEDVALNPFCHCLKRFT